MTDHGTDCVLAWLSRCGLLPGLLTATRSYRTAFAAAISVSVLQDRNIRSSEKASRRAHCHQQLPRPLWCAGQITASGTLR